MSFLSLSSGTCSIFNIILYGWTNLLSAIVFSYMNTISFLVLVWRNQISYLYKIYDKLSKSPLYTKFTKYSISNKLWEVLPRFVFKQFSKLIARTHPTILWKFLKVDVLKLLNITKKYHYSQLNIWGKEALFQGREPKFFL